MAARRVREGVTVFVTLSALVVIEMFSLSHVIGDSL